MYAKHLVIPDTQIKPGVDIRHLQALSEYILDQKPSTIIMLGDWADMHSLSSYDRGKKAGEGARVIQDLEAAKRGLDLLEGSINAYNGKRSKSRKKQYHPRKVLTLGNHENRIERYANDFPHLEGVIKFDGVGFKNREWEVYPFLQVVSCDGIQYSHYFPRNASGRITQTRCGAPNAKLQVQREGRSCTSGHLQGLDFHIQQRQYRRDYGLIAGSFYLHEEDYLSAQGTAYWRGIVVKHEVHDGMYDPMFVSMRYLLDNWWDGREYYA